MCLIWSHDISWLFFSSSGVNASSYWLWVNWWSININRVRLELILYSQQRLLIFVHSYFSDSPLLLGISNNKTKNHYTTNNYYQNPENLLLCLLIIVIIFILIEIKINLETIACIGILSSDIYSLIWSC